MKDNTSFVRIMRDILVIYRTHSLTRFQNQRIIHGIHTHKTSDVEPCKDYCVTLLIEHKGLCTENIIICSSVLSTYNIIKTENTVHEYDAVI